MEVVQVGITAVSTLLAAVLGGWLTVRAQDRLWRRDQVRQWRDIRLQRYGEFLTAFREYVAYLQLPTAKITAIPRARPPHDLMPVFDEAGNRYRERLEATKTALRLVSRRPELVEASKRMLGAARLIAAERATTDVESMSSEEYDDLWDAERSFVRQAREELGIDGAFDSGAPGPARARPKWIQLGE